MPISHELAVKALKQAAIEIGKKALVDFIVKRITAWAIGKISQKILGALLFIANPIIGFVVGKLVVYLVQETEFATFFWYIDTRTNKQGQAFNDAALSNFKIQQSGTPEEKKASEAKLRAAFYDFASWTN
jgi:cytosine/uracil/thiamine/allantoin permease